MNNSKSNYIYLSLLLVGTLVGAALFVSFRVGGGEGNGSNYFQLAKSINVFADVYREVNEAYVDDIEPAGLMKIGIDSMLKSLDPYTNYFPESMIENARLQQSESTADIGAELQKQGTSVVIQQVVEEMAAFKAGLKVGDRILSINGQDAKDRSVDEIKQVLRGQPGSEVRIGIARQGSPDQTISVMRDKAEAKSVPHFSMLDDKTGYIKLNIFNQGCAKEIETAMKELIEKNNMQSLVLDLRHNGGGLLSEAVSIVNLFVPKGELVVRGDGKTDEWRGKEFHTLSDPLAPNMPLTVLIDGRSASASEIVSGCMQDLDRGVVVGQRSFGKGLVQQTKDIGYNARLKLTVAKYFTPSGRCVQAIDYFGGYKDGATTVPDSLRKAFKTRNGRMVYDGSGVEPDLSIEKAPDTKIVQALKDNFLIFDYATNYHYKHPQIAPAKEFDFTDVDFNDFLAFLQTKQYTYSTETEDLLKKLQTSAEKEKYQASVTTSIAQLEQKIKREKDKDLERNKDEIKRLLKQEIIERYYYQKGNIEAALKKDPSILKSLELFADKTKYDKLLQGTEQGNGSNNKKNGKK